MTLRLPAKTGSTRLNVTSIVDPATVKQNQRNAVVATHATSSVHADPVDRPAWIRFSSGFGGRLHDTLSSGPAAAPH